MDTLENWAFGQEQWAIDNVFSTISFAGKRVATQGFPRLLNFSKDQEFANKWSTSLPGSGFQYTDTLMAGDRLFAASNGQAYELQPSNGAIINSGTVLTVNDETHIASDGKMLFAGCYGEVVAKRLTPWSNAWRTPMTGLTSWPVHVLYANGRLFAGSNGAVHELDPAGGRRLHSLDISSAYGPEVRLATDGKTLFAGCHGYVYGIKLNDWSKVAWTTPMTDASYSNVQLLFDGQLFAGSNGSVHRLDTTTGARVNSIGLSAGVDEEVRMTMADQYTLVAGCHGFAYGIKLNDWSKPAWSTAMAGKLWAMVDVAAYGKNVYAASNGYINRLNATTGETLNALQLSYISVPATTPPR